MRLVILLTPMPCRGPGTQQVGNKLLLELRLTVVEAQP